MYLIIIVFLGVLEGDSVKSSTYELEKGEFITEILGLFNKESIKVIR